MDLHKQGWFGQLTITGVGKTFDSEGSITSIMREFTREIILASPKGAADNRVVELRISERPITKDTIELADKVRDVWAGLDTSNCAPDPAPEDTFESYYEKLLAFGVNEVAARFTACDWFDKEQDEALVNWLADPKAIRFRQLNFSHAEYEKATPIEYVELKHYVCSTYPNQVADIIFRVA